MESGGAGCCRSRRGRTVRSGAASRTSCSLPLFSPSEAFLVSDQVTPGCDQGEGNRDAPVCASESTLAVLRLPPRLTLPEFGVDDPEVLFEPEPPGRRVNEVARSSPSRFGMNLFAHEREKFSFLVRDGAKRVHMEDAYLSP